MGTVVFAYKLIVNKSSEAKGRHLCPRQNIKIVLPSPLKLQSPCMVGRKQRLDK